MKAQHVLGLALVGLVVLMAPAASAQSGAGAAEVTYAKDIAPILQRSCQQCHRPASVAPMSLLTYEDVRPWARAIKMRTGLRNQRGAMPPWFVERDLGIQHFKNDLSLSEAEIEKIAIWADSGAPLGNRADLPPALEFADANEWVHRRAGSDPGIARGDRAGRRAGQVDLARHHPDRVDRGPLRRRGRGEGVQRHPAGRHRRHRRRPLRFPPHDLRRRRTGRLGRRVGHPLPRPRGGPQRRHLPGAGRPAAPPPGRRWSSRRRTCTPTAARRART